MPYSKNGTDIKKGNLCPEKEERVDSKHTVAVSTAVKRSKLIAAVGLLAAVSIMTAGCGSKEAEESNTSTSEVTTASYESDVNNYLEFIDEFSVYDVYGDPHYYCIVRNISDTDMNLTMFGTAYNKEDEDLGMVHTGELSLSPDDTYVLGVGSSDPDKYDGEEVIDSIVWDPAKFYFEDNAHTVFGYNTSDIEYNHTVEGETVSVTVVNNGNANAHVKATVIYYKDDEPLRVSEGLINNLTEENTVFTLASGEEATDDFRCDVEFDHYEVYVTAYADF